MKFGIGFIGSYITYFFGGWSVLLDVLLFMVILDYVSGFIAGSIEKKLSSTIGFKGIARKIFIFLLVAVAHKVDQALNAPDFFKNLTIFFYIANEGLSLVENMARIGVPVPKPLKKALIQIRSRSEE